MKIFSARLLFLLLLPACTLFSRNQDDNKLLFKNIIDVYPELETIIPQSDFHNSLTTFVPAISASRPTGVQSIPQNPLSKKDLVRLKELKIYNSRMLLEANALPVIFEMLTKSIADNDTFESGFWAACLSNNISGYSDLSKIAEINYLSEYIPSLSPDLLNSEGKTISMRGSATASLTDALRHDFANETYTKTIGSQKAEVITTDPEVMTKFLLERPTSILQNAQKHANYLSLNLQRAALTNDKTSYNGMLSVIKSSSDSIITTASIIKTAAEFASKKIKYKSPSSDEIKDSVKAIKTSINPSNGLFLRDAIDSQNSNGVGILVEPLTTSLGSLLGEQSVILASQTASALQKKKIEYTVLNLESILRSSFPSVKDMPVLIIPCTHYAARAGNFYQSVLNSKINNYKQDGGRILWLSSNTVNFLGDISMNLEKASSKLNIGLEGDEEIIVSKILTGGEDVQYLDLIRYPVQFGNIISSGYLVKDHENIETLVSVSPEEDIVYTVAAINKDKSAAYFNPIILYPAAMDKEVSSLIPAKFEERIEKVFLATVELLLDPSAL